MTSGPANFSSWMEVPSWSHFQAGFLKKGCWAKKKKKERNTGMRKLAIGKTKLITADNRTTWWTAGQSTRIVQARSRLLLSHLLHMLYPATPRPVMSLLLLTVLSSLLLHDAEAWSAGVKYAVNCPDRCRVDRCGDPRGCTRTVLDDCGCCQVCAAGRNEHCYRTVSGMHGVKCGPGLFCEFYKDEDDYGDEYGMCKGVTWNLSRFFKYCILCSKSWFFYGFTTF